LTDHPASGGNCYHIDDLIWGRGRDLWAAERAASDGKNGP
jgi:hypothetical protein